MNHIAWTKRKAVIALSLCVIIAVSSVMFLQNNQTTQAALVDPHPGLMGWWRFDEAIGSIAGDSSSLGNSGTIFGATWAAGKFGSSLNFQAIDASKYVDIPDSSSISPTSQVSLSCWLYGTQMSNTGYIWKNNYNYVLYSESDGAPRFIVWDTLGNPSLAIASSALPLNAWTYIVGSFGPDNKARIYINGIQSGTTGNAINNIRDLPGDLIIGKRGDNIGVSFPGTIDEVRVFNRTLSPTEIQGDFQIGPNFSQNILTRVPQGTTQVIITLSWQGTGSINATIVTPSQNFTEGTLPEYQKSSYSTSGDTTSILNVKRISVSVDALATDQNWYVALIYEKIDTYQITVEVQK
jgi:hypothetical protein